MNLPEQLMQEMFLSAEAAYPRECCGLILSSEIKPDHWRHVPMPNVQDELHDEDPVRYPRTARNAYTIDPKELLRVHKELRERQERIDAIYHSHPDQNALFSLEDRRLALGGQEEPVYAGTRYIVISVIAGRVEDWKIFYWDQKIREFKE